MATEFIELPGQLIQRVNEAAAKEEITPEELARDAVETRLSRAKWRKTIDFGHRNARERGLKADDVEAEIAADRAERTLQAGLHVTVDTNIVICTELSRQSLAHL